MSIDQIIRTKQSLIASTRHYSEAPLQFISFVEVFASMVQIITALFKSIQILLCKSKCKTFTLLQLENVNTTQYFLYFILGRHHLFTT